MGGTGATEPDVSGRWRAAGWLATAGIRWWASEGHETAAASDAALGSDSDTLEAPWASQALAGSGTARHGQAWLSQPSEVVSMVPMVSRRLVVVAAVAAAVVNGGDGGDDT